MKNAPDLIDRLRLFQVRGQTVVLDSDLALLYGVSTKRFNEQYRRNQNRFPIDFAFQLSREEFESLRSQFATLKKAGRGQHRKFSPWVFTEHGAIMAATILNSPRAVAMSVYVVRAFVRLRNEFLANTTMEKRLAHIEKTLITQDVALREIYEKIRPLLLPPPEPPKRRIGFRTEPDSTTQS
ncbi:MAG TPA: ORF6N domain-containing protein [Candidatus Paceibacterota bacterium]|nr:ORF6N domain-containing protein [Verrucomicrobiota bacterium]HRY46741.1 ORF6N domain-containing protein [Candidatus Paceibacterota bacterium]HSA01174.1 ORF6N domain-containing protein [Candidatus Paceibacterota bacterium]